MKQKKNPSLLIEGKLQPQAPELEESVLGAILIESKSLPLVEDILTPDDFYSEANRIIFKAAVGLSRERKPVDMLTVVESLKQSGELDNIGGPYYIARLTGKVSSSAHVEYHARVIKQKSVARRLISLTASIQGKAFDETEDVAEIIEELEKGFTEVSTNSFGSQSVPLSEAITRAINRASDVQDKRAKGIDTAIPTGLKSLNEIFSGGWRSPDLIILGARPSMGKTQHALSFAKAAAEKGNHVFFASLEMTEEQLAFRYLLEDDRISSYNMRNGQMSDEEWNAVDQMAGRLWNLPIHISGNETIRNLTNIRSEARTLKRKGKIDLMIVDYLGLIRTNLKFERRQLDIAYITSELKNLAKELNIPIILLSQLSRPPKGVVKEPQLEDLRESGDIEQDADIVMFLHKPDYYEPEAIDSNGTRWEGRGKIIISKYREGARNNQVIFYHDHRYKKIGDYPFNNPF